MSLHSEDQGKGQVSEKQGRYFYDIFNVLGYLSVIEINKRNDASATSSEPTLQWSHNMQANPTSLKLRVAAEILGNFTNILKQLADKKVVKKLKNLGLKVKKKDIQYIQKWKRHCADDFIIVGYVKEGAVLVQTFTDTVFIVKGLADPLGPMIKRIKQHCSGTFGWRYPVCHVALVPSPDGKAIVYLAAMVCNYTRKWNNLSPLARDKMFEAASGAFARAVDNNAVHYTLNNDNLIKSPLLAINDNNAGGISGISGPLEGAILCESAGENNNTPINVVINVWIHNKLGTNDPNFPQIQKDFLFKRPYILEGWKHSIALQQVHPDDKKWCPMCYGVGGWGSSLLEHVPSFKYKGSVKKPNCFGNCCKKRYLKLALGKHEGFMLFPNPIPMHVVEKLRGKTVGPDMNPFDFQRFGAKEIRTLSVSLPTREQLEVVRHRLHHSESFHATANDKFDFIGYCPITMPQGIITYGDVHIDDKKLLLEYVAMTSGRAELLITEMINLCQDLNPYNASVIIDKDSKQKLDKTAIARTRKLLDNWMTVNGSAVIGDKIIKEKNRDRRCSYCNAPAKTKAGKFKKCSGCGTTYYCDISCQKEHWRTHKVVCKKIQKEKKKKIEKKEKKEKKESKESE